MTVEKCPVGDSPGSDVAADPHNRPNQRTQHRRPDRLACFPFGMRLRTSVPTRATGDDLVVAFVRATRNRRSNADVAPFGGRESSRQHRISPMSTASGSAAL
jgi:hypothetical protein